MNALTIIAPPVANLPAIPTVEIETAYQYALNEKAPGTRAGYANDFRLFEGWCRARGVPSLPASPENGRRLSRGPGRIWSHAGDDRAEV